MAGLASGLPLTPQEVWSAIEKDPHWLDWQEGRISPHDWHIHLTKRLGTALTFEQFCEVWNLALDPNPIHSESFLEKLSKNYRLALLSNTDPLIYRKALHACKAQAAEAVYIDDVAAYAEAAERLGMTGIVFQSPEQLQSDLRTLGIRFD